MHIQVFSRRFEANLKQHSLHCQRQPVAAVVDHHCGQIMLAQRQNERDVIATLAGVISRLQLSVTNPRGSDVLARVHGFDAGPRVDLHQLDRGQRPTRSSRAMRSIRNLLEASPERWQGDVVVRVLREVAEALQVSVVYLPRQDSPGDPVGFALGEDVGSMFGTSELIAKRSADVTINIGNCPQVRATPRMRRHQRDRQSAKVSGSLQNSTAPTTVSFLCVACGGDGPSCDDRLVLISPMAGRHWASHEIALAWQMMPLLAACNFDRACAT